MKKDKNLWSVRPRNILMVALMLLSAPGCDNTLDVLLENKGTYSIFGYLDVKREVNFLRIKNLNVPLTKTTRNTFDGSVTLVNLDKGVSYELQDSVVVFDGVLTHNFKITANILPATKYKVIVEGNAGRTVTATTITPNRAQVTVSPIKPAPNCVTPISIKFEPITSPAFIELFIEFRIYSEKYRYQTILKPQFIGKGALRTGFLPANIIRSLVCGPESDCPGRPPRGPGICYLLDSNTLNFKYIHYGPDPSFIISDSLEAHKVTGVFMGLLSGSTSITIDDSKL